jgi:RNA polymerase sigma-70 factor (ECF subfamily)
MSINNRRVVKDTFEKLVQKHYKRVFNYIYMIVHNYELSQDLTQDTFLKAYNSFNKLKKKDSFPWWIMRIARNLSINQLRKEKLKRMGFVSLFAKKYDRHLIDYIKNPGPSPDEKSSIDEEKRTVRKVLSEMPRRMREVLVLKEWEELSYKEIGKIMGISSKAVKSLMHRARQKMRKRLEKEDIFR